MKNLLAKLAPIAVALLLVVGATAQQKRIAMAWDPPATNETVAYWKLYWSPTNLLSTNILLTLSNSVNVTPLMISNPNGMYITKVTAINTYEWSTNAFLPTKVGTNTYWTNPNPSAVYFTNEYESELSQPLWVFWHGVPPTPTNRTVIELPPIPAP